MTTILICLPPGLFSQKRLQEMQQIAPARPVLYTQERADIEARAGEIEIAAGWVARDLLGQLPNLRWFQQWSAGADWLLKHPEWAALDFILTNTSGLHAIPISEHILALLLAFARDLPRAIRAQAGREWIEHRPQQVFEMAGKTLLLIGVGAIGRRTALAASALGIRVLGVRRDPSRPAPGVAAMYGPAQLLDLLPQADFVVLTAPLTAETAGMIGEAQLAAMKATAYIINIGRGRTIQEEALVQALQEGRIAGAGLDVFEKEPLPPESPLWGLDNVIITSHYAGETPGYDDRAAAIFLDNLRRYQAGQALRNVVDKRLAY